jgi:hypothetical protein
MTCKCCPQPCRKRFAHFLGSGFFFFSGCIFKKKNYKYIKIIYFLFYLKIFLKIQVFLKKKISNVFPSSLQYSKTRLMLPSIFSLFILKKKMKSWL